MKSNYLPALSVLLIFVCSSSSFAKSAPMTLTLAVSEFRTQGISDDLKWLGKSFADGLIMKLSNSRTVRIVEREFIDQILKELELQMTGLVDKNAAVEVGKLLGAKVFVFGSISMLGDRVVVRSRIVSVERGEILGVAEANGVKDNMFGIQNDLAKKISSALAIEAAIFDATDLEVNQMSLNVYANLNRVRDLSKKLPFFGLDPARARKKTKYQLALSICDKLIADYPKLAEAHYYRALFSLHNEDFEKAHNESKIAEKLNHDDVNILLLKANVLFVSDDIEGAIKAFKKSTQNCPGDSRGWYGLGRLYAFKKDKVKAVEAYISSIERMPTIAEAETNLRTLLGGSEGVKVCNLLESQGSKYYAPARVFNAFWSKEQEIKGLAIKTISEYPDLYIGYFMQGIFESKKKQYQKALLNWKKCLTLRPSFPQVHKELGLLLLENKQCDLGKKHINIYMHTANFVNDYATFEKKIKRCKK